MTYPITSINVPKLIFLKNKAKNALLTALKVCCELLKNMFNNLIIIKEPFLVIKADAGTYGMGVIMIQIPKPSTI